jgi:selenocysteine lyase/cysteine desulfurase
MPLDPAALRAAEFPWMEAEPGAYLNAASVGPMPQRAVAVAAEWAARRARPHTIPFEALQGAAATARRQFAALVGADAGEVALMPNTTYGLNLAARGLPLRPGVILTVDGEFPSCVYPFEALGSRGITLERVPRRDGLPDEDALVAAIARPDVVAVVVSWVQFATGYVADLARLGAARGWGCARSTCTRSRWMSSPAARRSGCWDRGGPASCTCGAGCWRWCSRTTWGGRA